MTWAPWLDAAVLAGLAAVVIAFDLVRSHWARRG